MVAVSWLHAARYCNWLSQREGIPEDEWCYPREIRLNARLPANYLSRTGYRLPTEAEWEFACRAGAATARPFGAGVAHLLSYAHCQGNSAGQTSPVARFKPNDLGLFDVLGNAVEWTTSAYIEDRIGPSEKTLDTEQVGQLEIPDDWVRTLRGGAYTQPSADLRSAYRFWLRPSLRDYAASGFRIARTIRIGGKD
jgi:formylglycine-generating enzyme required for sulfatase activity